MNFAPVSFRCLPLCLDTCHTCLTTSFVVLCLRVVFSSLSAFADSLVVSFLLLLDVSPFGAMDASLLGDTASSSLIVFLST